MKIYVWLVLRSAGDNWSRINTPFIHQFIKIVNYRIRFRNSFNGSVELVIDPTLTSGKISIAMPKFRRLGMKVYALFIDVIVV